ncbi:MAG: hypothetical protein Q9222_001468 [Ikaeria aurantiellina]
MSSEPEEVATALAAPSQDYIDCECGEAILLSEFDEHVQLHSAESADMDTGAAELLGGGIQTSSSQEPAIRSLMRPPSPDLESISITDDDTSYPSAKHEELRAKPKHVSPRHSNKQRHTVKDWVTLLLGPSGMPLRGKDDASKDKKAKRLGRAELGPYAHEDRMPAWLHAQLARGAKVSIINQIGPSGQLSQLEVVANEARGILPVLAQLCEQDLMLCKVYLCHPGVQHVFKMAKEGGFCGYRNIQMMVRIFEFAFRCSPCLIFQDLFHPSGPIAGFNADRTPACRQVYRQVEEHFVKASAASADKVCRTPAPPIYLQHEGHSLTIVGLEVRKSGSRNLLVFDPSFKPSPGIQRLVGSTFRASAPEKLLKAYRRGDSYLGKHSSFEILRQEILQFV